MMHRRTRRVPTYRYERYVRCLINNRFGNNVATYCRMILNLHLPIRLRKSVQDYYSL